MRIQHRSLSLRASYFGDKETGEDSALGGNYTKYSAGGVCEMSLGMTQRSCSDRWRFVSDREKKIKQKTSCLGTNALLSSASDLKLGNTVLMILFYSTRDYEG